MNETFTNPTSKVSMTTTKFVNIICSGPWGNPSVQIIYPRMFTFLFNGQWDTDSDALPSPGLNPLEGSTMCSCGKLGFGRRSRLPAL